MDETKMKRMALGVALLAALVTSAAQVVFPNLDGSYDLASDTAWGTKPAETDSIQLNDSGATYGFSKDTTFASIYFNASGQKIELPAGRKVTLGSTDTGIYPYSNGNSLELNGGTYDFSGTGKFAVSDTTWGVNQNNSIVLTNGVVVTNTGTVRVRYGGNNTLAGPALRIAGRGTLLYSASGFQDNYSGSVSYSYTGDPTEKGVGVDVCDGARFVVRHVSGGEYFKPSGVMLIRGAGTVCEVPDAYAYVGVLRDNTVVHVTDGGQFTIKDTLLVPNDSRFHNGRLYIDNNGVVTANTVYLGSWSTYGCDHAIIAGPGGTFSANNIYVSGTNNWFVVSNGTMTVGRSVSLGFKASDRGLGLKIYGPSASYTDPTLYYPFASGSGHRLLVDGGASLTIAASAYVSNGSTDAPNVYTSNRVEVVGGSTLTINGGFNFRNYQNTVAANGNTVRVADGSMFSCVQILIRCTDNALVISNGTVTCSSTGMAFICGGTEGSVSAVRPTVVFEGETPRLSGNGTAYFYNDPILRFNLTPNGYATDSARMTFGNYHVDSGATVTFEITGVEALQRALRASATYVLAEATSGTVAFPAARIEAANALLPKGCTLKKSNDNKQLLLHVKAMRGTYVTIR